MVRLSRDFGKREKFAALHPVDLLMYTSAHRVLGPLTVSPIWNSKVNSCSAGCDARSVRTRIEHDPQRDGEALDIDALVPGKLQRNTLQDRDHDAGGRRRIEMPRPAPLSLRLRDHRRQHVHGLGDPRKRFALQAWIGKALGPKLHGQMTPSPFLRVAQFEHKAFDEPP